MNFLIKTSSNLYMFWNLGSLLMMNMVMQIMLGFMLSNHYFYLTNMMYKNSMMIMFNFNYGWTLRFFHSNLTSMIFIILFIHMTRSMIFKNYMNMKMWNSGIIMLLLLMMISFLGYSLINSQMAYWASMVITNFIAIIPILGKKLMFLLWGDKFINNILLNRFFAIHFLLAMLLMLMSLIHLIILHMKKSSNPFNTNNNLDQINLNPLFIFKDIVMFMISMFMFLMVNMIMPIKMNNSDNFNMMMIFKTPNHIEPEWYFLFFYSILRSNENKMNGLLIMLMSIMIWFMIPLFNKTKFMTNKFFLLNKIMLTKLILILILISFIGTKTSKEPYIFMINFMILIYFLLFITMIIMNKMINLK